MWLATLTGPLHSAGFEKTLTTELDINFQLEINDRKKILCDRPPLHVPCIRWNWSQVLKPRRFRESVEHRIEPKFPAWKLTIEKYPMWLATLTGPLDSMELFPGPETSPVSSKRWPQNFTYFPAWKLMIERKSHVIDHPNRSPGFDGIGSRSGNIACFEKTWTTSLDANFQHEN